MRSIGSGKNDGGRAENEIHPISAWLLSKPEFAPAKITFYGRFLQVSGLHRPRAEKTRNGRTVPGANFLCLWRLFFLHRNLDHAVSGFFTVFLDRRRIFQHRNTFDLIRIQVIHFLSRLHLTVDNEQRFLSFLIS